MPKPKRPANLRNLAKRANQAGGQAFSIKQMVRDKRPFPEIMHAVLAIEGSIKSIIDNYLTPISQKELAAYLNKLSALKNKSPEFENFIAEVRQKFPHYKLNQIPRVFYYLRQFECSHKA